MGAHGWVARICQPWEWSPSRSRLPIVEAPGCLRHPVSTSLYKVAKTTVTVEFFPLIYTSFLRDNVHKKLSVSKQLSLQLFCWTRNKGKLLCLQTMETARQRCFAYNISNEKTAESCFSPQMEATGQNSVPFEHLQERQKTLDYSTRGGEWSFQKYGSRKIVVKFLRSRSLEFCTDYQRLESLKFLQGS